MVTVVRGACVAMLAGMAACSGLNPEFDPTRPNAGSGGDDGVGQTEPTPGDDAESTAAIDDGTVDAGEEGTQTGTVADEGPIEPSCPEPVEAPVVIDFLPGLQGFTIDPCGVSLDLLGLLERVGDSTYLHTAVECNRGDSIELAFSPVAPQLLDGDSHCVRLQGEYTPREQGCALVWLQLSGENQFVFYEASTLHQISATGIDIKPIPMETCECVDNPPEMCCDWEPGNYGLEFDNGEAAVVLAPGETRSLESGGPNFEVYNGMSYVVPSCGDQKHLSWYVSTAP